MNPRGMLMLVLTLVVGSGRIMCQIEAGKAVPLGVAKVAAADNAKIKAGRGIQITIKGIPPEEKRKIDAAYPVSEEGMVNLPFVGKVNAEGKTPEQLARAIEKAYVDGQIFAAPQIQVFTMVCICGPGKDLRMVHMGGQVRKTGPHDFADGMTVGDAIKAAGGATIFGSLKRVKIFRDGKMVTYDLTKEKNLAIPLQKNDTIEVPQKNLLGE